MSNYEVFSGPHFSVFGLNKEIYSVNFRIQSEYQKTRTRENSVFGHFSRSLCIVQLLLVMHEIQTTRVTTFYINPTVDVRGPFFDVCKSFDKVWHEGLIFKSKLYGVESELFFAIQKLSSKS